MTDEGSENRSHEESPWGSPLAHRRGFLSIDGSMRSTVIGFVGGVVLVIAADAVARLLVGAVEPDLEGTGRVAAELAVFACIVGVGMWFALARPLQELLRDQQAAVTSREEWLVAEATRQEFDARLQRALDMVEDEGGALQVVGRALDSVLPDTAAELLLADSSHAHLRLAVTAGPDGEGPGCPVESPRGCAAVRRGQTLRFASSEALDACPRLRGRPGGACSAVCVPVTILGHTVGVMHTARPATMGPTPRDAVDRLESIATQAGTRIGNLRAFARSEVQASTDPLTGLLNRRSVENNLRELARDLTPFTVAMGDLDHFKQLNDTHGHEAGDRALRLFAQVLRRTLRPGDLVARFGGEEFLLVFPSCSTVDAVSALERVREALALALSEGGSPGFTASFGVADSNQGDDLDEIVAVADQALFAAKVQGRNRVVVAGGPLPDQPVELDAD
ncbi:MAG: GGDEF domain-containing protein [Acidimicrobiales bacterium]|nr:GGDEF domain-containing protein [Acidimicrobiales bacterium]